MQRKPLEPVHAADGVRIGWATTGQSHLADAIRRERVLELAELARRAAVRRGEFPADAPAWKISDRH